MRPPSSQQAGRPSHTAPPFPTKAPGPRAANRRLASTAPRPVYEKLILRGPCKPKPFEAGSCGSPNCFHCVGLRPSHQENEDRSHLQYRALPKDLAGLPAGAALPSGGPQGLEPVQASRTLVVSSHGSGLPKECVVYTCFRLRAGKCVSRIRGW